MHWEGGRLRGTGQGQGYNTHRQKLSLGECMVGREAGGGRSDLWSDMFFQVRVQWKEHWCWSQETLPLVSIWPCADYVVNLSGLVFACIRC